MMENTTDASGGVVEGEEMEVVFMEGSEEAEPVEAAFGDHHHGEEEEEEWPVAVGQVCVAHIDESALQLQAEQGGAFVTLVKDDVGVFAENGVKAFLPSAELSRDAARSQRILALTQPGSLLVKVIAVQPGKEKFFIDVSRSQVSRQDRKEYKRTVQAARKALRKQQQQHGHRRSNNSRNNKDKNEDRKPAATAAPAVAAHSAGAPACAPQQPQQQPEHAHACPAPTQTELDDFLTMLKEAVRDEDLRWRFPDQPPTAADLAQTREWMAIQLSCLRIQSFGVPAVTMPALLIAAIAEHCATDALKLRNTFRRWASVIRRNLKDGSSCAGRIAVVPPAARQLELLYALARNMPPCSRSIAPECIVPLLYLDDLIDDAGLRLWWQACGGDTNSAPGSIAALGALDTAGTRRAVQQALEDGNDEDEDEEDDDAEDGVEDVPTTTVANA